MARAADLAMPLAGRWAVIPLREGGERAKAVRKLVDKQCAGTSASATLKRRLRAELDLQTAAAKQAGGLFLGLLMERAGEYPMNATVILAVSPVGIPTEADAVKLARRLHDTAGGRISIDLGQGRFGPMVRTVAVREHADRTSLATALPTTTVRYWMDLGGARGMGIVTFSAVGADHLSAWLEYFDWTVAGLVLADPPAGESAESPGEGAPAQ
jgi:hypothetical protein